MTTAEEGVVRISDSNSRPGVVRLGDDRPVEPQPRRTLVQRTAYGTYEPVATNYPIAGYNGHSMIPMQSVQPVGYPGYAQMPAYGHSWSQPVGYSMQPDMYGQGFSEGYVDSGYGHCNGCDVQSGGCGLGGCGDGCVQGGCCNDGCNSGHCRGGRRGQCDECWSYGEGYNDRMVTLFARACPPDGCTRWPTRWWRGQQHNYLTRNQRLSNHLFGWMVPSGCCGHGCPPVGCYNVTYADDPGYADARDGGQAYGAQGYGIPMTVPLAPNVRHSYNYSWGTPSSRITPLGQYAPGGAAMQSSCQSW
ncbi:MAG: hypothetical protein R3C49_19400 [Planctomycetaceae bacterium]